MKEEALPSLSANGASLDRYRFFNHLHHPKMIYRLGTKIIRTQRPFHRPPALPGGICETPGTGEHVPQRAGAKARPAGLVG